MVKITNEILYDFIHCHYKASKRSRGHSGIISDFENISHRMKQTQILKFEKEISLKNNLFGNGFIYTDDFNQIGTTLNIKFANKNVDIILDGIELTANLIIPLYITPFEKITDIHRLFISLQAAILQKEFRLSIENCKIIYGKNSQTTNFKNARLEKSVKKLLAALEIQLSDENEPELILNKHCQICEFSQSCREKALREDNITLLDRVTEKIKEKYKKKGIFTIQQLSHLYKPKRRKQRNKQLLTHSIELQALSIRTNKIYVQQLPGITRGQVEIYLDIEGNPDVDSFYLIGVLVVSGENLNHNALWAYGSKDEGVIWEQFTTIVNQHPDCPIYHYGSYETKAIKILGKRHNTDVSLIQNRLLNVNQFIYGKVYFPTYSNKLKEIGKYIGASWSSINAHGIQALVWWYEWEENQEIKHKEAIITYNQEDCAALKKLVEKLFSIQESADTLSEIDFAINPKKNATEQGKQIHKQFSSILKFGYENYDSKKISFTNIEDNDTSGKKKLGGQIGHEGKYRKIPNARKIITVPMKKNCPKHNKKLKKSPREFASRTITELNFSKNSIRKSVIKYTGPKGYCCKCKTDYSPDFLVKIRSQHFGYNLKAWIVYQRLFLRLPYDVIKMNFEELFHEKIGQTTISDNIINLSAFFENENNLNIEIILNSPFIHVDETQVNVKGVNQYVWIFTNGTHVYFRITETRETTMVEELLAKYNGILISDFYSGYDSLKCKHQKCWVHLIRDMNDDLWKFPFDSEYEKFVLGFRNLILPIFEAIARYGSKKYHFNKFKPTIKIFYSAAILGKNYNSDTTIKYQKRLEKYWDRLFTFIEYDNIPWNNNMAERGLRHLAVQRKISSHFNNGIHVYLLFLGIMQTCRFQKKSFFKFLLSKKPADEY